MTRPPTRLQTRLIDGLIGRVLRIRRLARLVNRFAINGFVKDAAAPEPAEHDGAVHVVESLTDRTWSGRHLPPVAAAPRRRPTRGPPAVATSPSCSRRDGEMVPCPKSTVLFTYFAQWFTDGFLRTDRHRDAGHRATRASNESNHEIDLCSSTGSTRGDHRCSSHAPRRAAQEPDDQRRGVPAVPLRATGRSKPRVRQALTAVGFDATDRGRAANRLFAMGTDVAQPRLHGVQRALPARAQPDRRRAGSEHPAWDDDRLFETTRNILTVVLMKIVVEEYINHITPVPLPFTLHRRRLRQRAVERPNWMAIEFNLLYRWHSLVPSTFGSAARS